MAFYYLEKKKILPCLEDDSIWFCLAWRKGNEFQFD